MFANRADAAQDRAMTIRIATVSDRAAWAELRGQLWPGTSHEEHLDEIREILAKSPEVSAGFLEFGEDGVMRAFAEVGLRHDHVNGCATSPVAFLEGIYVCPEHRGAGIGRALLRSVQAWAEERGCRELGSDAHLENVASHAFHEAFGFEETERVVFFRKML